MTQRPHHSPDERLVDDARAHERARLETLRQDGRRELGENLEQAAVLIKVSFELRDAFSTARR